MSKIVVKITAEPEDESPERSEKRTGSAPGYAKAVREQMKKAVGGWGWCSARMEVKLSSGEIGTAYLGNCSYLSAEDFVENSGYYSQMFDEAFKEALEQKNKRNEIHVGELKS